jgi:DNA polymerase-3 subunit gamma/tau
MAYQALYRVWRSQRFDDIVGQKAITQTLKNAIMNKKTSHAYLFTGPRGTGKTSAAKIFSKAINCPNSQDGEPCNECEMCRSITEGRQEDVIEIDAASNNGVEEIRFIRDRANYAPTNAAYKVYIIDEVHMLSTGAFNALLKTLEEPKEHVIFILATTEPHKIPATIISRTQRFDFKRITVEDMVTHMKEILAVNHITYDNQALYVIAGAAEGGMRDALSILDQAISFSGDHITLNDAMEVTGSLTYEMMDEYLQACLATDVEAALKALNGMLLAGKEASRLLEDLLLYCRDMLLFQQAPNLLVEKRGQLTENFQTLAKQTPAEKMYQMIKVLSETQNEIRYTNHANIYLEVATVKLATKAVPAIPTNTAEISTATSQQTPAEWTQLQHTVAQLQAEIQGLKQGNLQPTPALKPMKKATASSYKIPTERVYQVLQEATKQDLLNVKNVWDDLLMAVSVTQRAMLKAAEATAAGPDLLLVTFDYEIVCQRAANDRELQEMFSNKLSIMVKDYHPDLVFIPRDSWPDLRRKYLAQGKQENVATSEEPADEISLLPPEEENPVVEQAKSLFGEAFVTIEDN